MKRTAMLLGVMFGSLVLSCTNKQKHFLPKSTQDSLMTVIGDQDSTTEIILSDELKREDADTVIYELPQCSLWYTKELAKIYNKKNACMWTERKSYWENVSVINVFVANPAHTWWYFGRGWYLYVWNGEEWVIPRSRKSLSWTDEAFGIDKAPLLYCFRIPVGEYYYLPKGKYRIIKNFRPYNGKGIDLTSEFEVK